MKGGFEKILTESSKKQLICGLFCEENIDHKLGFSHVKVLDSSKGKSPGTKICHWKFDTGNKSYPKPGITFNWASRFRQGPV